MPSPQRQHSRTTALAVTLMLDGLRDTTIRVSEASQALTEAYTARDDYIRDVLAAGISMARVGKITGLTRERLYRIKNSGESPLESQ